MTRSDWTRSWWSTPRRTSRSSAWCPERGFERADAEARIRSQISRAERVEEADYVLDNSGDWANLEAEVSKLWEWLLDAADQRRAHA